MKKTYTKPWIVFEDFSSKSIGCDAVCIASSADDENVLFVQDAADTQKTPVSAEE